MTLSQRRFGGLPLTVWFETAIILALLPQGGSILVSDRELVDRGFEAGKEILGYINQKDFAKTLTKLTESTAPFLGAFGPFLGFVFAFLPSAESAELAYMKDMMAQIDNEFNQVDNRFNDIERLIEWTDVAVNFGQIESDIKTMHTQYEALYNKSTPPSEGSKSYFVMNYEGLYLSQGTKLYLAVTQDHGMFQENLCYSVMRYTKYDRKKTQDFLLGILRLLFQAIEIELAYSKIAKDEEFTENKIAEWKTRIQEVKNNFEATDTAVKDKYLEQSGVDIEEFSADNYGLSNGQFATDAYEMLKHKYYWRDWMVVSYNKDTASTANTCGGYKMFNQDGRHFVIASVDSNHPKMGHSTLYARLNDLGSYAYTTDWLGHKTARRTSEVFDRIDKSGTCSLIVMKKPYTGYRWYSGWSLCVLSERFRFIDNQYQVLILFA